MKTIEIKRFKGEDRAILDANDYAYRGSFLVVYRNGGSEEYMFPIENIKEVVAIELPQGTTREEAKVEYLKCKNIEA